MQRRDLVLARVGPGSLHQEWLEGAGRRDWDLLLVPYTDLPAAATRDCMTTEVIPGPKWTGLREALRRWDGWRAYDHVWMPDDDIETDAATIGALFEGAAAAQLDLFAPALHEDSYYAHFSTMVNRRFHGRRVGFVEIMVPGFSRRALDQLLWTLDLTRSGWGWGLDSLWPKLLGHRNVGILDATPVLHTRPVGQMRDDALRSEVHGESDHILATYECSQVHATFGAFGPDGQDVELDACALFAELVAGWGYLIDRDPRILAWIAGYQLPQFSWPAYPVAGTPEVSAPAEAVRA